MAVSRTLGPAVVLLTWGAGIAGAAALVAWWRIVGAGFTWLAASVILVVAGAGWAGGGGLLGGAGVAGAVMAAAAARRPRAAAVAFGVSAAVLMAGAAVAATEPLLVATGALALGGVTAEMLLGHWYLVDPRLPRWALRRLDVAGAVGLVLDGAWIGLSGGWPFGGSVVAWGFLATAVVSVGLMAAVWAALRQPSYQGVMSATGLSYLAVLTSLGATIAGRSLVGEVTMLAATAWAPR